MTVPPAQPGPDDDRPPPWAGAPGYSAYGDDLPPHAPMPGAPPYPAAPEEPPPIGRSTGRTSFVTALGAVGVWAVVHLVITLLVAAPTNARTGGAFVGGLLLATAGAAVLTWLVVRHRGWPFWLVLVLAAPVFWVLRLLIAAV